MRFSLLLQNTRELWKEWEMRLLVLLSLFLQLTLATLVRRRKFLFRHWIHVMVWTMYLSADYVANFTLGILSSRLANIQETKMTIYPKSQITAFWAPFLLLHLGGPDTITAYVQGDNDLWLRQLARFCIQVGLACFIYFMALSGSTLSKLAAGMILVGFVKYAERILSLYLASKGRLRDSVLWLPKIAPLYSRIMQQYLLKKEEGYLVTIDQVEEVSVPVSVPDDFSVNSGQASKEEKEQILFRAYDLFKIFKPLFFGFIGRFSDLYFIKDIFMSQGMDSEMAFGIMEIELGFMYDLLYTKAPLLNRAWGIIRWVINLSVPCAVLVFFSLQDKQDYDKVDICITFLLITVAILLEIYSLFLAISSDWVNHWWIQRPGRSRISSVMAFREFCPNQRWSNSVAQFSLLGLSVRKINRIVLKYPFLAKLDEKLMIFNIGYKGLRTNMKEWIFRHMKSMATDPERRNRLNSGVTSFEQEVSYVLKKSNHEHLTWSVEEMEFDQTILIWHIATELCYHEDHDKIQGERWEHITDYKMSKLVSRYMLYLILLQPSMLPTGIGVLRYQDTSMEAREFFEVKLAPTSKKETSIISLVYKMWAQKSLKIENHVHTGVRSCGRAHKSTESSDLCELRNALLQVRTGLHEREIRRGKSRSVLFDACHLASQLKKMESDDFGRKWYFIGKVWATMLIYAAGKCKGHEHCESLSRGGELLSHIWLLMAHLGIAEAVQTSEPQCAAKLIKH